MALYLGVDAGATKTDYALADETRILSRARSGTLKRMRVDAPTAAANLDHGLSELLRSTGISLSEITRTCIGAAGNTVPLVVDWLRTAFAERIPGELLILGDVEIALEAAFPSQNGVQGSSQQGGVLALAGTGSNVAGRTPDGYILTTGGWGPVLADQGSGHRIGLQALRSAFLALDEGRESGLLTAIMAHWSLDSLPSIIAFANQSPGPDLSQLTPVITRCAEQGDALALEVLDTAGRELAYLVRLAMRRLRLQAAAPNPTPGPTPDQTPDWTPPLAFTGSILERVPRVREALIAAVREEFPAVHVHEGVVDPIDGAIARARQAPRSDPNPRSAD